MWLNRLENVDRLEHNVGHLRRKYNFAYDKYTSIIKRVSEAIADLKPYYIKFPEGQDKVKMDFRR